MRIDVAFESVKSPGTLQLRGKKLPVSNINGRNRFVIRLKLNNRNVSSYSN